MSCTERNKYCNYDLHLQSALHGVEQAHVFAGRDSTGLPGFKILFTLPEEILPLVYGEKTNDGIYLGFPKPELLEAEWRTTRDRIRELGNIGLA